MKKTVDVNLNEITRHLHPMAGKRSANERYSLRAVQGGYRYTCLVHDPKSKGGQAKHPGYAMIFKVPERDI